MHRATKIKSLSPRVTLRKAAMSASAAARRGFPAWIDADDNAVSFSAKRIVMPRVRDALVLRTVSRKPTSGTKGISDARRK
jgi:hypothetical protein